MSRPYYSASGETVASVLKKARSAWASQAIAESKRRIKSNLAGVVLSRQTGTLYRNVRGFIMRSEMGFVIKAGTGEGFYGYFWERGFKWRNKRKTKATVVHPMAARPFAGPVLEGMAPGLTSSLETFSQDALKSYFGNVKYQLTL